MTIAERLIASPKITNTELKYLLWLTLLELQNYSQAHVSTVDPDESFNINEVLDALDADLGVLP